MKTTVKLKGTDKLLKKFESFGVEALKDAEEITKVNAEEIKEKAKQTVRVDSGKLRQSIFSEAMSKLSQRIAVGEKYGAYVEFGTGGMVDIPKGWESMATRFKGKGIKQINIPARPYLYPAFKQGSKQYVKDLENSLKKLTAKHNKK